MVSLLNCANWQVRVGGGKEMVDFDREEYLDAEEVFEAEALDIVDKELCEFNNDIENIAIELAYTRYELAKAEKLLKIKEAKRW